MKIIAARILIEMIPAFERFSPYQVKHIEHKYSEDSAKKSEVVSKIP